MPPHFEIESRSLRFIFFAQWFLDDVANTNASKMILMCLFLGKAKMAILSVESSILIHYSSAGVRMGWIFLHGKNVLVLRAFKAHVETSWDINFAGKWVNYAWYVSKLRDIDKKWRTRKAYAWISLANWKLLRISCWSKAYLISSQEHSIHYVASSARTIKSSPGSHSIFESPPAKCSFAWEASSTGKKMA